MDDSVGRRKLLGTLAVGAVAGVAGCNGLNTSGAATTNDEPTPSGETTGEPGRASSRIDGRVFDLSDGPVAGATVKAIVPSASVVDRTTADDAGRFELVTSDGPVWLRVTASGYVDRTVAAGPGETLRVELTPSEGTVSMSFGGDTMFGRRFYEDDDPLEPHTQIREETVVKDHERILRDVAPLLETADVTSVNLETPLTTTEWRHPSKLYQFVSDPAAGPALRAAGVDYVALGNNHILDGLLPGLEETVGVLDDAGLAHSGAGKSSQEAWSPAIFERNGVTVGLLSCSTVVGEQYDLDWSADRGSDESHTVQPPDGLDGEALTMPGAIGVAEATERRLRENVEAVATGVDVTVVQIHGGTEYQRTPTERIERLTEVASDAGADIVVNHHPHVTGGLERRDSALVAWSLGNLVFDQNLWSTFQSYILSVHVTADGVRRAYLDPIVLSGYVPRGVVGDPRTTQLRRTAGLSPESFALHPHTIQFAHDDLATRRIEQRSLDGNAVYERESGWVNRIVEGAETTELGHDLLPTGSFEDEDVGDPGYRGPLWRFGRGDGASGSAVGVDDTGGVRLTRTDSDSQRAILSPAARIPAAGPLTLTGRYRYAGTDGLELLVRWYESTSGDALDSTSVDLGRTGEGWGEIERDLSKPAEANYIRFYFRLSPPENGADREARFDALSLVEWVDETAEGGREYDHIRLGGPATVEFGTNEASPDGVVWSKKGG